jgi:PatG C-terminal
LEEGARYHVREKCNGLTLPIVIVDQIYSFDRDILMNEIPKGKGENQVQFRKTSDSLFDNLLQIADNVGGIDEHHALNYLAVRYAEIYNRTQLMQDENYSLSSVDVRPSYLSGDRKIVDIIFSFDHHVSLSLFRMKFHIHIHQFMTNL